MTLHFTIAELDTCRNRACNFMKRGLCFFHLLFCKKCRASLKDLQNSDVFLAAIKKTYRENEA